MFGRWLRDDNLVSLLRPGALEKIVNNESHVPTNDATVDGGVEPWTDYGRRVSGS